MNITTSDFCWILGIMLFIFFLADICFMHDMYTNWIEKGKIVELFPAWKGTKTPFHWFLGWGIAKSVADIIAFIVFAVVIFFVHRFGWVMLMLPLWLVCLFFEAIVYVISRNIVASKVRRKNPQPTAEESDTDDTHWLRTWKWRR